MTSPIIGVTGGKRGGFAMWIASKFSLWLHGARARRLTAPFAEEELEGLSGLLIGGGDDISAALYGAEPVPDIRIDPERDELEIAAIDHLWETKIPIFGICRGSQILNAFAGGSLHQDIYSAYKGVKRMRTPLPRKRVQLKEKTRLHRILNTNSLAVNALHHQSVDQLGNGFKVSAVDEHGIVQATEMQGSKFRIGVQWHPELLPYRTAHRRLFGAFVDAARRYGQRHMIGLEAV